MASCRPTGVDFETIIPSPGQKLRLYVAVNQGLIYYLVKQHDIVIGWSNIDLVQLNGNQANRWQHALTNSELNLPAALPAEVCPEALCNMAELEFTSQTNPERTLQVQFVVNDSSVAIRYKVPANESYTPLVRTELLLHKNGAPWSMQTDSTWQAGSDLPAYVDFPVSLWSHKNYRLDIYNVPFDRVNLIKTDSNEDRYFFDSGPFNTHQGFLYSGWYILKTSKPK